MTTALPMLFDFLSDELRAGAAFVERQVPKSSVEPPRAAGAKRGSREKKRRAREGGSERSGRSQ
jgi:hypothetical protein